MNGNFGLVFKSFNEFPKIHQCVICIQLPTLRRYKIYIHIFVFIIILGLHNINFRCILESMCMGFNCKNNYFPVSILTKILLHNKDQDTAKECKHYGITVIDGKAELSKASFNNEAEVNF